MGKRPTSVNSLTPYTEQIVGVDDPAIDNANFAAFVAAANAAGQPGTLYVKKKLRLSSKHRFDVPMSLSGWDSNSEILFDASTATYAGISWRDDWSPRVAVDTPIVPLSPVNAGAYVFTSATLDAQVGDWVVLWSDDPIVGCAPHSTVDHSMEMWQIRERIGNNYYFDGFLSDNYTINPQCRIVPMMGRIVIENLIFGSYNTGDPGYSLSVRLCDAVHMERCTMHGPGPGSFNFNCAGNVHIAGLGMAAKVNAGGSAGYGVVAGLVNGFVFSDSVGRGCRHLFTTSGAQDSSGTRWGTGRNIVVQNVISSQNGSLPSSSLISFDTHSSGYGTKFISCTANLTNEAVSLGFSARARATVFENCNAVGGSVANEITKWGTIYADDCKIMGGSADRIWHGPRVSPLSGHVPKNATITNFLARNLKSNGIYIQATTGSVISQCTFEKVGRVASSGLTRACVTVQTGVSPVPTGVEVRNCSMPKDTNLNSVDCGDVVAGQIKIRGNTCDGYGLNDPGFAGTNAQAIAASESKYNIIDT